MLQKQLIKQAARAWSGSNYKIILWDGEEIISGDPHSTKFTLILKQPLPLLKLGGDMSLVFAEAYMNGLIEIEGDFDEIAKLIYLHSNQRYLKIYNNVSSKIQQTKERNNIKTHYDLGNDFYELWLDESMSYSCAYFKKESDSLYQAQMNKIDHTLKKLDLKPNEKLLDIGCGWGWLSISAAQKYNAQVVGITISEEQYKKATQRVKELNLQDQVEIRLQNYQDLEENEVFDKIVSVGMFEHVGQKNLPLYFKKVKQVLKPGGMFLLHSIFGMFEGKTNPWIDKYIFPGGYLPSLREVVSIMSACDFHLLLAESLRMHYAKTLEIWLENFEANLEVIGQMYDERFIKMWWLYLKSCASAFRVGSADLFQILMTKGVSNQIQYTHEYIYKD